MQSLWRAGNVDDERKARDKLEHSLIAHATPRRIDEYRPKAKARQIHIFEPKKLALCQKRAYALFCIKARESDISNAMMSDCLLERFYRIFHHLRGKNTPKELAKRDCEIPTSAIELQKISCSDSGQNLLECGEQEGEHLVFDKGIWLRKEAFLFENRAFVKVYATLA